jgi:hypothetical protein
VVGNPAGEGSPAEVHSRRHNCGNNNNVSLLFLITV